MGTNAGREGASEGAEGEGVEGAPGEQPCLSISEKQALTLLQPKYIGQLLHSATVRKLDHLRAEEKMIQRERETEGDEFADKEHFVTQAYKDQMAEVRRAEEEEKKREGTPSWCHPVQSSKLSPTK